MTPSQQMEPRERLWLAIIGVIVIAVLALQEDPVHVERVRAAVAECNGLPVCVAGGGIACIDSATLVALPAPVAP